MKDMGLDLELERNNLNQWREKVFQVGEKQEKKKEIITAFDYVVVMFYSFLFLLVSGTGLMY